MKTKILSSVLIILSVALIYSCKKEKKDTTPPVITLKGINPVTDHCVGTAYIDAGATANDETDGDITLNIRVTANVDTTVTGTYLVKYNVSDKAGNDATEVIRTVTVINCK
jgi:hypothetical protein